ncbi:hypothetical protein B566_EDAN012850 [Ephemera danica]|nr:hypothetical protein B566_EDAN012850 [Ephemera danica]
MIGVWDHLRATSQVNAYVVIADGVFWSVIYFVRLVLIANAAYATHEEVQLMREQLQHNCRAYKFPIFGLFCIDRGFLWTACGSVVAYFFTVLQFHLLKTHLQ